MATTTAALPKVKGGSFLIESLAPDQVFTPEDLTEEQRQMGATAEEFIRKEVFPLVEELEHQAPGVAVSLMRKAGELSLLAVIVPERYGGLEMDKVTALLVAEQMSGYASFSSTFGAHSGIATLPIVFF